MEVTPRNMVIIDNHFFYLFILLYIGYENWGVLHSVDLRDSVFLNTVLTII